MPPPSRRLLEVGTGQVSLRAAGVPVPGRPLVVLLPGAGDVTASWLPVLRGVAPFGQAVTFERSGIRGSAAAGEAALERHIAELDGVLDALGADQAILVGHSFGGLLARVYASLHPERVAGLVLVDVTPVAIPGNRALSTGLVALTALESALHASARFGLVRALLRLRALPHYPEQRRFERHAHAGELREWTRAVDERFRTGSATELRSVLPVARAAAAMLGRRPAPPSVPVTMLTSRAYGSTWVRMHDDIAAELGGSTHVLVGGRHHNIHMTHPDLIVEAIRSVLFAGGPAAQRPTIDMPESS